MKYLFFWSLILGYTGSLGQNSGNINYPRNPRQSPPVSTAQPFNSSIQLPSAQLTLTFNDREELYLSVKGMYNVEADSYLALFSITQIGKTTEEVHQQLESRIGFVQEQLTNIPGSELYVDAVSFVPIYEYEVENKVFSRKTYNEIPAGFDIKKTLHIHFPNEEQLKDIMEICSKVEIYDLIRVDYLVNDMELKKAQMIRRADSILSRKISRMEQLLDQSFGQLKKEMVDGFQTTYPVESYRSYQAFSSPSLQADKSAKIKEFNKSLTTFHQPFVNKDLDFVINPITIHPCIQLVYELKMRFKEVPPPVERPEKEYYLLNPNGDLRPLKLEK